MKSVSQERRLYPWIVSEPLDEDERFDLSVVDHNLTLLGYPTEVLEPANPYLTKKFIEIMDYFDPNKGGMGKWLIIASNNVYWLQFLKNAIPITYARSFKRSVHPMSADNFFSVLKSPEQAEAKGILPFGFDNMSRSRLVMFSDIGYPVKYSRDYISRAITLFGSWQSVCATEKYATDFHPDTALQLMGKIEYYYGSTVRANFVNNSEILVLHDSEVKTVPLIRK